MISRTEFELLPQFEKAHTLFEFGDVLEVREEKDFRIKLYLISDFFVELWVSAKNARLNRLVSLSEEDVIEIYADSIHIDDLF